MDKQESDAALDGSEQQSTVPVPLKGEPLIGYWRIEKNPPFGFVIRNIHPQYTETEYHFHHDSNGWITGHAKSGSSVMNPTGKLDINPIFVDEESLRKEERMEQLKRMGQALTIEQAKELLELAGLLKPEA